MGQIWLTHDALETKGMNTLVQTSQNLGCQFVQTNSTLTFTFNHWNVLGSFIIIFFHAICGVCGRCSRCGCILGVWCGWFWILPQFLFGDFRVTFLCWRFSDFFSWFNFLLWFLFRGKGCLLCPWRSTTWTNLRLIIDIFFLCSFGHIRLVKISGIYNLFLLFDKFLTKELQRTFAFLFAQLSPNSSLVLAVIRKKILTVWQSIISKLSLLFASFFLMIQSIDKVSKFPTWLEVRVAKGDTDFSHCCWLS